VFFLPLLALAGRLSQNGANVNDFAPVLQGKPLDITDIREIHRLRSIAACKHKKTPGAQAIPDVSNIPLPRCEGGSLGA
jgi:hypothetical protein